MIGRAADNFADSGNTDVVVRPDKSLLSRKIWLPRLLYAALPCFYILAGLGALAATIYIGEWFWVLPHYLLFACACLHMGVLVMRRRRGGNDES